MLSNKDKWSMYEYLDFVEKWYPIEENNFYTQRWEKKITTNEMKETISFFQKITSSIFWKKKDLNS